MPALPTSVKRDLQSVKRDLLRSLGRWSGASITYTNKFKYKFSKIRALAYLLHKVTIGARIIYKYKFK